MPSLKPFQLLLTVLAVLIPDLVGEESALDGIQDLWVV